MAVNKKKVESTTTKKVKNYGKEYIQNIKLDVENSKPLTLTYEQLIEKLQNNKRYETITCEAGAITTAPVGFWKHNLPEGEHFVTDGKWYKIIKF